MKFEFGIAQDLTTDGIVQIHPVQLCDHRVAGQAIEIGCEGNLDIHTRSRIPYFEKDIMQQVFCQCRILSEFEEVIVNKGMVLPINCSEGLLVTPGKLLQQFWVGIG